jgi:hypothetical protein
LGHWSSDIGSCRPLASQPLIDSGGSPPGSHRIEVERRGDERTESMNSPIATALPAVDLNGPGHYISFGILNISVANAIVILLMVAVFVLALVLPFPGGRKR